MSTSTSGGTRPPSPRKGVSFSHDVDGGAPRPPPPMTNGGSAVAPTGEDGAIGGSGGNGRRKGVSETTSRGGRDEIGGDDRDRDDGRRDEERTSSSSVPLICLSDGIARKADVISLSSWVALMLTLDGRDKITKTVQYTCRLIGWYYENLAASHGLAQSAEAAAALAVPYRSLQKTLTNSRKAFRLGRFLIEFQKLRKALPGIREGVTKHPVGIRVMDSLYSFADGDRAASRFGRGRGREDEEGDGTGWITGGGGGNASSAKSKRVKTPTTPLWKSVGISCKLLGLAGFWAGDNLFFLTGAGFFPKAPKDLKARAQRFACRSYFFGAVVGLFVNLKEVRANRPKIRAAQDRVDELAVRLNEEEERVGHREESETCSDDDASAESFDSSDDVDQTRAELEEAMGALREARERQFVFCVALLKSCCDTMVFSNMPGVDLHRRYRGRKMNEGFQCLCGLTSASTVLYNNFPNRPKGATTTSTGTRRPSTEERRRAYSKRNFASSNWYAPMS